MASRHYHLLRIVAAVLYMVRAFDRDRGTVLYTDTVQYAGYRSNPRFPSSAGSAARAGGGGWWVQYCILYSNEKVFSDKIHFNLSAFEATW